MTNLINKINNHLYLLEYSLELICIIGLDRFNQNKEYLLRINPKYHKIVKELLIIGYSEKYVIDNYLLRLN
jgi:hypothetical protein